MHLAVGEFENRRFHK